MKETRNFKVNGASDLVLQGLAVVYDEPTVINDGNGNSYTEIIRRGALDEAELSDSRLLLNHDQKRLPLARTPKTMKLEITDRGLQFRANLAEANKDVYESVKRGDIDGCSFCFTVGKDSYDPKTNTRKIEKIDKVYELSLVNFPAYQGTSVEARDKMTSMRNDYLARREAKIKLNKILFRG